MRGVHAPDHTYLGTARSVLTPQGHRWEGELDPAFGSELTERHFEAPTYDELRQAMIDRVGDDPARQAATHRAASEDA